MNSTPRGTDVSRHVRRSFAFGVCLAATAASSLAQTTTPSSAPPKEEVIELTPFMVSTQGEDRYRSGDAISAVRVRTPLLETPSSISVITRDMMDDLAPTRLFDVTRYVAGVQEGRGIQFQDRMIIRGFETQNGARTVDNFLQSADADNIEEAIIDRVEVTKGPNAILSPAGAPGGSVNVITKSPVYKTQRSLTALVGLYDAQKITLDVGDAFAEGSPFAYRLVGSYQDSRRYWSSDAKIKGSSIAPMLSWRISDKSQLTLKFIAAEHWIFREPLFILSPNTTASTSDPQLYPGIDPSGLNGIQPWSHVDTASSDLFAVYTTSFNEHISLRTAANGRYYHETSEQNFLSTPGLSSRYNPSTGELTQDYTWTVVNGVPVSTYSPWIDPTNIPNRGDKQDTTRKTANLQADLAANYQFGAISSQTVIGAAYSRQYAYNKTKSGTMPGINLYNQIYATPVYPADWTANNGSSYTNRQIYISERIGLLNDRLYVSGGLLNYATITKAWNELTHSTPSVLDDNENMWNLGLLYKVTDKMSVYASRSNNASPVIANNQPLWRTGEQDEFGVKTEFFNKRLSVNLAYFEISQTNVTIPNPAYQTDPTQPQQLVSDYGNKGWEVEVMGGLTKNLSIITTYSHLKMRDSLGRMVRGVADNTASALVNYRFLDGSLKSLALNFGVNYSGKRAGDVPDGNFTALGVVKQVSYYLKPQYTTTAGASYRWSPRLQTRLIVDNLFDEKDYVSVAGGRISGTGLTTQPGLNVRLSTTFSF